MGIEVIVEDYVKNQCSQKSFIGLVKFINIATFAFLIFAIIIGFTRVTNESHEAIPQKENVENIQN